MSDARPEAVTFGNKTYWKLPGIGEAQVGRLSHVTTVWIAGKRLTFRPN